MGKRINSMYRSGYSGYIPLLLGGKDLSELVERIVFVKNIIEYDKNLINDINSEKEAIELKKQEMDSKKIKLQAAKTKVDSVYSQLSEQSKEKNLLVSNLEKDKEKYQKIVEQEEADAKELQEKIRKMQTKFKSTNAATVKSVSVTGRRYAITSNYGLRMHPVLGYTRFHAGIDIGVPMGTPIYSLSDGIVVYSGTMSGYGNVVMINHGNITSLYAHNSSLVVEEGQVVKGGQLITYSGNSGISSGPHLHFEIRTSDGSTINPAPYYK